MRFIFQYKTLLFCPLPQEQIQKINKTIGTCRFIYNFYIAHNKELYNKGEKFMTAKSFSVWLNNEFLPNNPNYS